jgi:hypothetical protein
MTNALSYRNLFRGSQVYHTTLLSIDVVLSSLICWKGNTKMRVRASFFFHNHEPTSKVLLEFTSSAQSRSSYRSQEPAHVPQQQGGASVWIANDTPPPPSLTHLVTHPLSTPREGKPQSCSITVGHITTPYPHSVSIAKILHLFIVLFPLHSPSH